MNIQIENWAKIIKESNDKYGDMSFSSNDMEDCLIFDPETNLFLYDNGQFKKDINKAKKFDFETAVKIQKEFSFDEKTVCILKWY